MCTWRRVLSPGTLARADNWRDSPKKLASMLHREHVCVEIGNPLLSLLRDSKVAQGISDIRSDRLPEEIWIVSSQICDAIVFQFIGHSRLAKLVKKGG